MADEANLSKRERQKARREAKLVRERQAAQRSRMLRLSAIAVVALILVAAVGVLIRNQLAQRAAQQEQEQAALESLEEFGCTADSVEGAEQADAGAGHLGQAQLAASPPETLYPDRPASSGQHYPQWTITGVYDKQIDERILVHNLEHGYVTYYYDEGADEAEVDALKEWAQGEIEGDHQKIIVAPWDGELAENADIAMVAWNFRQMCADFDEGIAREFVRAHHGINGVAPEKNLPPHRTAEDGIDPADTEGPLLLPPLGEAGAATEAPGMGKEGDLETEGAGQPTEGG